MASKKNPSDVLVSKTSFVTREKNGARRRFSRGTRVRADDPVVKGREDLFVSADDGIETTRSAPGEKRTTRRKKTSSKTSAKTTASKTTGSKPADGEGSDES